MPWQGHLYVGVPVADEGEALKVYEQLGIEPDPEWIFSGKGRAELVHFRGHEITVYVAAYEEQEGGEPYPRIVGFPITGRYKGAVIDRETGEANGGRADPFVVKPADLQEVLDDVHLWWPEAEILLMDIHF